jgi:hypothetical protein
MNNLRIEVPNTSYINFSNRKDPKTGELVRTTHVVPSTSENNLPHPLIVALRDKLNNGMSTDQTAQAFAPMLTKLGEMWLEDRAARVKAILDDADELHLSQLASANIPGMQVDTEIAIHTTSIVNILKTANGFVVAIGLKWSTGVNHTFIKGSQVRSKIKQSIQTHPSVETIYEGEKSFVFVTPTDLFSKDLKTVEWTTLFDTLKEDNQ